MKTWLTCAIAGSLLLVACGNGDQGLIIEQKQTIADQKQEIRRLETEIRDTGALDASNAALEDTEIELETALTDVATLEASSERLQDEIDERDQEIEALERDIETASLKAASESDIYTADRAALTTLLLEPACLLGTKGTPLRSITTYAEMAAVAPQLATLMPGDALLLFEVVKPNLAIEHERCALAKIAAAEERLAAARANFEPTAISQACDVQVASISDTAGRRSVRTKISDFKAERFITFVRSDEALSTVWADFDPEQQEAISAAAAVQVRDCISRDSGYTKLPIGSGTWDVGAEIAAGTWRAESTPGSCYWARNDANGNIRANNFITGTGPVQIRVSSSDDNLEISDCGTLTYVS